MFNDEKKPSSLAISLNVYDYVIVDTCSLMEEGFPSWMDTLSHAKEYLKDDLAIYVPAACIAELKKHCKAKGEEARRVEAKRAIKILKAAKRGRMITILKTKNENFADNVIYTKVAQDRLTSKILVITQDKKLCSDLKALNELQSQRGHWIAIEKITPEGDLKFNRGEEPRFQHHERNGRGRPFQKPAPKTSNPGATPVSSFPEDPVVNAKKADGRLRSVLGNKTYPEAKKREDLIAQRDLLRSIPDPDKAHLKLFYPLEKIEELLNAKPATTAAPKAEPAPEPKPTPKPEPKPLPKEEKKPAPVEEKKPEPKPESKPVKKLWYEEGETLSSAIVAVASHYGVLLRDPSIAYFPAVHGPYDLTSEDASKMALALQEAIDSSKKEVLYKGFLLIGEKKGRFYRVQIDFAPELPDTKKIARPRTDPVPNPLLKAAKEQAEAEKKEAPKAKKPAPKKETAPKKEVSPKPEANEPKPKKDAKAKAIELSEGTAAVPTGVNLVVGIPDDQKTKEKIERSARKVAPAVEAKKKPAPAKKETAPKKAESKPAKAEAPKAKKEPVKKAEPKQAPKKEPAKKAEPKPEPKPKKEAPKKEATPKKEKEPKKAEPKKPEPKKAEKPEAKPAPKVDAFEAAKKAEARLKTVITNPNYPNEKKAADIEAQLDLIRKLTPSQRDELNYGMDALKGMLSILK